MINKGGVIIGGHARYLALKNKNVKEADCYIPDRELTEQELKELNVRLNKNIAGEFDFDVLANEFELNDLLGWGFEEKELDLSLWSDKTDEQLDDAPEPQKEAISKTGDLFLLDGRHRVLCGDSTKIEDVEKLMDGKKAELLFTSPPYSDMREYNGNKNLDILDLSDFIRCFADYAKYQVINLGMKRENNEIMEYWQTYISKAKESGYKFLSWNIWDRSDYGCGSVANATVMFNIVHEWIFVFGKNKKDLNLTIPNKNAGQKKRGTQRTGKNDSMVSYETVVREKSQLKTIYKHSTAFAESSVYKHPAMFPSSFPIEYVNAITDTSDLVIDSFLGSGSTLVACEQTNRICYGMEIDPIYIDVILRRYHKLYPDKEIKCLNRQFNFKKLFTEDA